MRRLLASLALLLPTFPASPAVESHAFTAPWHAHVADLGAADNHWAYTTSWVLEVPAPSEKPSSADIRALTSYVYKHIASNLGSIENVVEFRGRTFLTSVTLEGVELVAVSRTLPDIGAVLGPWETFWGTNRPKAHLDAPMVGGAAGGFPEPVTDTWELRIEAVSYFDFEFDGPTMFGESARQRIEGTVRYRL